MRPITATAALLAALLLAPADAHATAPWTWPVQGEVVTPFRNGADPYAAGQHRGVDIAAPVGARVVAAAPGTITFAGTVGSSGLTVAERTADGSYVLSYLHLASVTVRRGDTVAAGDALGAVGTSGRRSTERPHLHFGVRESGDRHAYVDPLRFLAPPTQAPGAPQPPAPVGVPVTPPPATAPVTGLAADAAPAPSAAPAPAPVPSGAPAPDPSAPHLPAPGGSPSTRLPPLPGSPARRRQLDRGPSAHAPAERADAPAPRGVRGSPTGPAPASPAHPRDSAPARSRGIDLGWLAACIGLIAAAALLAGPGGGRHARPKARAVFATLLRAGSRG
jgi:hypothetical protein